MPAAVRLRRVSRITELFGAGPLVSVELWPPRSETAAARLENALAQIDRTLRPAFYSITYGAGGSTRERTHDLVVRLSEETGSESMAHLVCAAHRRAELTEILTRYREAGVENILALRGDPPLDSEEGLIAGELKYAVELVELAKSVGDFCVAVAAHPECHPDSPDRASDRRRLAEKLAVADFAITQFFFKSADYLSLVDELAVLGCDKPVLPGIMPVTSLSSVPRMAGMGAPVPGWMVRRLEAAAASAGAEGVRRCGTELATELCRSVLAAGAPGLHFYTLNRSHATRDIYLALGLAPHLSEAGAGAG